jgi:phosphoenolpyruvate carboxykinase (GTP)
VASPPRIFCVNWFRRGADGKFLWPGYGENMRVLQWIVERCRGRANATQSALGWMPSADDLDWTGLDPATRAHFPELMSIERDAWIHELLLHEELFVKLYDKLPKEFVLKRELLLATLWRSPEKWTVG